MDAQPIENHGIIGDLHTAALVGMDGSIDFMSFPRFDSPTIFAALLDPEKGGHFQIAPAQPGRFRHKHPVTNRVAFAAVARVFDHANAGGAGDFGGAVPRSVVDYDNLREFPTGGVEIAPDLLQGRSQAALFGVRRNDNGNGSAQAKPYNN